MQCEQVFKFLDKPETLETISFLFTKWKTKNGGDAGSSMLKTYGCCLCPVFDKQQWESFINWDQGQAKFNELMNHYRGKGFKSRQELGIKPEGNCHDEEVLNIRLQLWNLHVEAVKQNLNIPSYSNSPDVIE